VLAGLTTVLSLWHLHGPIEVLPVALASIAAAITGLWGWQENWVRFAAIAEALQSELVKFETRPGDAYRNDLDEARALDNFVVRIEALASNEVAAWNAGQASVEGEPE
jgi:hypothetical protein